MRQLVTLTVELDVEAQDWNEIVVPGRSWGEDFDPPVDKREQVEGLFHQLLTEALGSDSLVVRCTLKPQQDTIYDETAPSDF